MAYILGFVTADGNIAKRKDRKSSFIFNITSKDREHLGNMAKWLGQDIKLGWKAGGYTKKKDCSYFNICNREMCLDLINLGIVPRKTYSLIMPQITKKYFADYTRGFFDGDGSVYIYSVNDTPQIKAEFVCCSLNFITEFNRRLCRFLSIPCKNIHVENINDKIKPPKYTICFYIDDCQKFADFMYDNNPSLFLPRKREIFERWATIDRRGYKKEDYPSKVGWQLNQNKLCYNKNNG